MDSFEWFVAGLILGCLICAFGFCAAMSTLYQGKK